MHALFLRGQRTRRRSGLGIARTGKARRKPVRVVGDFFPFSFTVGEDPESRRRQDSHGTDRSVRSVGQGKLALSSASAFTFTPRARTGGVQRSCTPALHRLSMTTGAGPVAHRSVSGQFTLGAAVVAKNDWKRSHFFVFPVPCATGNAGTESVPLV